jgi:general secretion pathway protein D
MEGTGGKLEIDKRSNRIIVFDIPDRVERVRALVKAFDVKTLQVLIQAKIVEVRLTDAYRKGINWQEIVEKVGDFNTLKALVPLTVGAPTGAAGLATMALGEGQDDLQVLFQLLEQVGKTNILSSPRLMALNNEEAKLAVATREPFVSQTVVQTVNSTNTADNVQFVDVGVTLKVHPRISQDHFVEMKIKPADANYLKSPIVRNSPNIDKVMKLGWKPKVDVATGFKRTIESFLVNNNAKLN